MILPEENETAAQPAGTPDTVIKIRSADNTGSITRVDPSEYSEETLEPPGHTPNPANPYVLVVSIVDPAAASEGEEGSYSLAPLTVSAGGDKFWVAFTSRKALRNFLGEGPTTRSRMELSALIGLFVQLRDKEQIDVTSIVLNPSGPTQRILSREDMEQAIGSPLTGDWAQKITANRRLPMTFSGPLVGDMLVAAPIYELEERLPSGSPRLLPVPMALSGGRYWMAFTSFHTLRRGMEGYNFKMHESSLALLCDYFLDQAKGQDLAGIVIDACSEREQCLSPEAISKYARETVVQASQTKAAEIQELSSPLTLVTPHILQALTRALREAGVNEAWGMVYTYTNAQSTLVMHVAGVTEQNAGPLWHRLQNVLEQYLSPDSMIDIAIAPVNDRTALAERGIRLIPA